ncbi:MFS transporter [Sphingomonas bisphenolicum]|uniref:MFS transporter n=1 Tax=Sphingomonas bisphenolicum TaxID=296544 RepID=A0ABM7G2Z0_9SPHN|nr:MFS transporter [Sphingomonas bisphenolicum]BBF69708.1 MFS transporter [Sphingomonas bisphenolicum]
MARIRWLTYLMFLMFAMTSESVGVIIPSVTREFNLGMTAGGSFHYATMSGIALGGVLLGSLADRLGRKATILIGLGLFGLSASLFAWISSFGLFLVLLFVGGIAVGIFKTAALALIGDISTSTRAHTATMNVVEGFFGIGAIIGPAIVAYLLSHDASWKWLYLIAAIFCGLLMIVAWRVPYPPMRAAVPDGAPFADMLAMLRNRYALAFSSGIMLYVGVETAIYVWMPTLLAGYSGPGWQWAVYALSIFFILRVIGRFGGFWLLERYDWTSVMALCGVAILLCFACAIFGGRPFAVIALPLSGLFMSVIYPTLNSKGISCFPKAQHGAISGVILFFTCVSAVAAPLTMGLIGEYLGDAIYGFYLATAFAAALATGLILNMLFDPASVELQWRGQVDYQS